MGDRHHHHSHHNQSHHHHHHHHQQQQQHRPTHSRQSGSDNGKVVVCYLGSWAAYRPPGAAFVVEDIDPSLCTHVVYAFAGFDPNTCSIVHLDAWQDLETGKGGYKRAVALKRQNPRLKVTIAIGGWNEGSAKYSTMAASHATRTKFIKSVLAFLQLHKFDGLDLDWEYPTQRGGEPQDKANFAALVKELKTAFMPHNYILTAALGAGKSILDAAYDLPALNRHLDLIHVMCYDYHCAEEGKVGANAPLKGTNPQDDLNLDFTIKYMLKHGVSADKLVLGVPTYGKTFLLQNPSTPRIEFGRTPTHPSGFQGPLTGQPGFMGYNEIAMELQNNPSKWTRNWDQQTVTPYLRNGDQVVSYDNTKSITMKVKLALNYGLKGIMVWSVETDDFKGIYKNSRHKNYPLLRTINYELGRR